MTEPVGVPGDEVPEADWAEQIAEAGAPADGEPTPGSSVAAAEREADEADLVEQEQPVDLGDDDQ